MWAEEWWFWTLVAALAAGAALAGGRYRALVARARRGALERRLVEPGSGHRVDTRPEGFWSELSWLTLLLGAWVAASPWIWGYDDTGGAVSTDVVTGGLVVALTLAGIFFPALNALVVLAGTWLVLAPWVVGYGNDNGAVGLSDVLAGVAISALAIASMAAAGRRVKPGGAMPIGRVRRPGGP